MYGIIYGYIGRDEFAYWHVIAYDRLSFTMACNECYWIVPNTTN